MELDPVANRPPPPWPAWHRIAFRFAATYLVLYNLPFPASLIPGFWKLAGAYRSLWFRVVPWVGSHVFGATITVHPNGSGDTTFNYVQVFCFAVAAVVATLIWTLIDRKHREYSRLHDWLRIFVRFSLASTLIQYGAIKVIQSQFPDPGLDRLLQPFGDASPMGLLWTFMGASKGYNVFTGAAEILGGLLLTTRRTTLLGALVALGTLANVVALNLCYDVPVKLFSIHLLAMAVFLVLPDAARLSRMFLLGQAVEPAVVRPVFVRRELNRAALIVRTVWVVGYTMLMLANAQSGRHKYGDLAAKPAFYGIWNVEGFVLNGMAHPPLATDVSRWQRVIFDYREVLAIQDMSGSRRRCAMTLHTDTKTIALKKRDDPDWSGYLAYSQPDSTTLTLQGTAGPDSVQVSLRRVEAPNFLLRTRGFHWINEYPFNR